MEAQIQPTEKTAEVPKARRYRRATLLDTCRGIAVVNMIFYHLLYDYQVLFGNNRAWDEQTRVRLWQQLICCSFVLLSGWVWRLGKRNNLRRGVMLNLLGFIITLITLLLFPQAPIWFGILNFIGGAVLLMIPLEKPLRRIPRLVGAAVSLLLFILTYSLPNGAVGLPMLLTIRLPRALYRFPALAFLGFAPQNFFSADYFPLLPWFFLYLFGYFLGGFCMALPGFEQIARCRLPPFDAVGRYSLWIYLAHQPLCMAICWMLVNLP